MFILCFENTAFFRANLSDEFRKKQVIRTLTNINPCGADQTICAPSSCSPFKDETQSALYKESVRTAL